MRAARIMSASAALALATAFASPAFARAEQEWFDIGWGGVGASSTTRCFEGLCARVFIQRENVNGDRNEVCVELANEGSESWSGGYRLTHLDDPTTFASLRVGAGQTSKRCEIVPRERGYYLVLRTHS